MLFPYRLGNSMPIIKKNIEADDGKGRDYICSAEGASILVNLSGKRTLVGRSSGERSFNGATKGESLV
jgi:hypothetical protein